MNKPTRQPAVPKASESRPMAAMVNEAKQPAAPQAVAYVPYSTRLHPQIKQHLRQAAFDSGRSAQDLLNEALDQYLATHHASIHESMKL